MKRKPEDEEVQKNFINQLIGAFEAEGHFIHDNNKLPTRSKIIQADILIDLIKFLKNYDEATKVLNEQVYKTRFRQDSSWDSIEK